MSAKKSPDPDAANTNGTKEWFESLKLQPGAKVAIVTHDTPDPDAIGAALACQWLFRRKFQVESTIFCKGSVSHPQNKTVVNLLNIDLRKLGEDDLSSYALRIVVDATPATWSRTGESGKIAFDAYFDHHPKATVPQKWSGHADYRHAGSACAIMRSVMRELGMEFDADNEDDQIVATAMVVGIRTDTEEMSVDDTSEIDLLALAELHPFVTQKILRQIIRYPVPKLWYELRRKAEEEAASEGSALVTGLGFFTQESRDALAWVADDLERRDGVDTCVAFGIIEDRIVGVVRCSNPTLELNDFVRRVFGEDSVGGGKRGKAAATAPLGLFFSSYTDSSKAKLWDAVRIITTERAFKAASGQ